MEEMEKKLILDERKLEKDIKKAKNYVTSKASETYETLETPLTEEIQNNFSLEMISIFKKRLDGTIDGFIPLAYLSIGADKPSIPFSLLIKTEYFQNYGLNQSKLVTDTTFNDIKKQVAISFAEGKTSKQIAKDILKVKKINKWRAETIARTETGYAAHFAQRASIEDIQSKSIKQFYKKWLTSRDVRVRKSPPARFDHTVMEGVIVRSDELFNVQGDRIWAPRDPKGQPGNVINCRCGIVLYREDEL